MTLLEFLLALLLCVILVQFPGLLAIGLFLLPVWFLVFLIRFWRKNPSIWQMRRQARREEESRANLNMQSHEIEKDDRDREPS